MHLLGGTDKNASTAVLGQKDGYEILHAQVLANLGSTCGDEGAERVTRDQKPVRRWVVQLFLTQNLGAKGKVVGEGMSTSGNPHKATAT